MRSMPLYGAHLGAQILGGGGGGASGIDRSKGNGPAKSVTFSVWTTLPDSVFRHLFFTKEQQARSWWACSLTDSCSFTPPSLKSLAISFLHGTEWSKASSGPEWVT